MIHDIALQVVLKTSRGDVDIELWPKEAPRATRNFVHRCLQGYYNGTIINRIVKNYLVQGGDPTGTGTGGESIYGAPFEDEFHSRLRFSHRGIVACVNQNTPNSNGSQFFITLDRAEHLNRKATIFGKVVGDTIYNLERFNDVDTDDNDRPLEPVHIHEAHVIVSPFDDLQYSTVKKLVQQQVEKVPEMRKGVKNYALMSFEDEENEDDMPFVPPPKKKNKNLAPDVTVLESSFQGADDRQHDSQDHADTGDKHHKLMRASVVDDDENEKIDIILEPLKRSEGDDRSGEGNEKQQQLHDTKPVMPKEKRPPLGKSRMQTASSLSHLRGKKREAASLMKLKEFAKHLSEKRIVLPESSTGTPDDDAEPPTVRLGTLLQGDGNA